MTAWGGRKVARLRAQVVAVYGTRCHLCGRQIADALRTATVDHLIPRSAGGPPNVLANLRPAHASCNYSRQDMPLHEWFRRHPLPQRPALTPSRNW